MDSDCITWDVLCCISVNPSRALLAWFWVLLVEEVDSRSPEYILYPVQTCAPGTRDAHDVRLTMSLPC